jgi:hypothetical protein
MLICAHFSINRLSFHNNKRVEFVRSFFLRVERAKFEKYILNIWGGGDFVNVGNKWFPL